MFQINKLQISLVFMLFIFFHSCVKENKKPDVGHISKTLKIFRTESSFFRSKNAAELQALRQQDSVFFDLYVNHLIGDISGGQGATWDQKTEQLLKYITHEDMTDLLSECSKKFSDFSKYEEGFSDAFQLYKYYLPKRDIPDVYTFVAPFRAAHPCWDKGLGVALDMYLGEEFSPYYAPMLEFPQYQIRKMRPDYLLPNAMKAWLMSEFLTPSESTRMIDEMVHTGKILFTLQRLLPETADSLIIGYQAGKLEFCRDQETQIWENIITNKMLYSTDKMVYRGYLGDGPFSTGPGVPQEAPPGIGDWAGWQIVKAFMDKNPKMEIEALFKLPADQILKESGYKP